VHGVEWGGEKGNVTLRTFDGRYKVERCIQERIEFTEVLQAAKVDIDACLRRWAEAAGDAPELKTVVDRVFSVDSAGNISVSKVLGLRTLNIKDPQWVRAMETIASAIFVNGTRQYIRVFERVGDSGKYVQISLDLASV
jgi:hypothetical protein